jgi:hypothetical protein
VSTELAVTAVTETLLKLLRDEVASKWDHLPQISTQCHIEALPLHKVRERHASANVLNLFLYRTEENAAWRNIALPVQGKPGQNGAAPLALNLEYLITAYGEDDKEQIAHYFLGQAMRILHDAGMVPRQKLFDALKKARLHNQIERITITSKSLSIEEISKLWSAFQTQYRVSAAYLVTVVLIDSKAEARSPLPVLKRGPDDRGVNAVAAAPPTLDSAAPASGLAAVRLGEDLLIRGDRLNAGPVSARVSHPFLPKPQPLTVTSVNAKQVKVTIPDASTPDVVATWPAGIYGLTLEFPRPGQPSWITNEVPFILAPAITVAPAKHKSNNLLAITIKAQPQIHRSQPVIVIFDDAQIPQTEMVVAFAPTSNGPSEVKANVPANVVGFHRVRLRVGGIDSIPIKKTDDLLDFDPDQSVEVTP